MTLSGVTIHAVILSNCPSSSKYSIRSDSEAQQQEVQLQQTTLQSEEGRVTPAFLIQNWADIQAMTLLDCDPWPDHGANEWFHTSYSSHYGVVQASVWMRPESAMIHCRSVSSPARQSTSTVHLMVTSRKGRLLITTTPRRFPHHCQALGLVITNTTWSVFSFQNVSTIVRSCYTSHHDTSSLAKCPKPRWWW